MKLQCVSFQEFTGRKMSNRGPIAYQERVRLHICPLPKCGRQFFDSNSLLNHQLQSEHIDSSCCVCHKTFRSLRNTKRHIESVHSKNIFGCWMCHRRYNREDNLRAHQLKAHGMATCRHCQAAFRDTDSLKIHLMQGCLKKQWYIWIWFKNWALFDFYRPQTKLREGNVFTPVYQSFCSQGGVHPLGRPPPPRDGHWSGQYASYWNSFLLWKVLQDLSEQSFLAIKSDLGLVTWMFDINFEFMNVGWNLNMTLQVPLLEWKKMLIFIFVKKLLLYFYVCPQKYNFYSVLLHMKYCAFIFAIYCNSQYYKLYSRTLICEGCKDAEIAVVLSYD